VVLPLGVVGFVLWPLGVLSCVGRSWGPVLGGPMALSFGVLGSCHCGSLGPVLWGFGVWSLWVGSYLRVVLGFCPWGFLDPVLVLSLGVLGCPGVLSLGCPEGVSLVVLGSCPWGSCGPFLLGVQRSCHSGPWGHVLGGRGVISLGVLGSWSWGLGVMCFGILGSCP
jgi:hypothetical protein